MKAARFRIFISSPSDVFAERERLDRVIARLNGEYGGGVLEAVRWERAYYSAAKSFQEQIPLPAETDLVICILWKRLGVELPPDYRRPDGTTPTGTEFEFENAIEAARAKGTPDVLVYRKAAPVLLDAEQVEVERAQFELLKLFWSRWFHGDGGPFTAAYQSFETADGFEVAVEEHIRRWLARHHVDAATVTWPIALRGSPFRGLQAFDADHSDVFFGRRRAIERARERLVEAAGRGTPFLLILGASGSGKSSLARAGLLPRLVQPGTVAGIDVWRSAVVRPSAGDDPADALARALYLPGALPELAQGDSPAPADFAALVRTMPDAAGRAIRLALARATAGLVAREQFGRPVAARLLLTIDQFEEALSEPVARDVFGRGLAGLVAGGLVWVVATLRSDLYAMFQVSAPLLQLRDSGAQLDLIRPTPAELGEMIERPAAVAGLTFDRDAQGVGLEEVLTSAADQPGALPLLQLTLDALFQARDSETNLLTFAAYERLGGLPGVIERCAEEALNGLDPAARAKLPDVLRALVDLMDDGAVTSRAMPLARVARSPEADRLVSAFSDARLLIAETQGGERQLRVAHEALLSGWPRAAALIAADREALRTRRRVEAAARTWRQEGGDGEYLLPRGRPLAEAVEFVAQQPDSLDAECMDFVRASQAAEAAREAFNRAAAERELRVAAEAQQARADAAVSITRTTRKAAGFVAGLLVLALVAAGYAFAERQQARRRTAEAEREFAAALSAGASMVDIADAHLADGGMSRDVAQSLLHAAEASLGGLTAEGAGGGPRLHDAQAQMLGSFSKVQLALCDSAGARLHAQQAVEVASDAAAAAPSMARSVAVLRALGALGQAAVADGDRPAGIAAFRRAEHAATSGGSDADDVLRAVRRGLASALSTTDRPAALQLLRDDLAWQDRTAAARPDDPAILGLQATDLGRVASLSLALRHLADAAAALERERAILQRLMALQPGNMDWLRAEADRLRLASDLSSRKGDDPTALDQALQSAQAAARLVAHDPGNVYWQRTVINAQLTLFSLYKTAHDVPRMIEALRPALALAQSPLNAMVTSRDCRVAAARLRSLYGIALSSAGDSAAAAAALKGNLSLVQSFADAAPQDREAQFAVADAHVWLAGGYVVGSRLDDAFAEYRAGLGQLQRLLAGGDGSRDWPELMARLSHQYCGLLAITGKTREALATQQDIGAAAERMISAGHDASRWQDVLTLSQLGTAFALSFEARQARSVTALGQQPMSKADLFEQRRLSGAYDIAMAEPDDAATDLQAALSLVEGLAASEPDSHDWPAERESVLKLLARANEIGGAIKMQDGRTTPAP